MKRSTTEFCQRMSNNYYFCTIIYQSQTYVLSFVSRWVLLKMFTFKICPHGAYTYSFLHTQKFYAGFIVAVINMCFKFRNNLFKSMCTLIGNSFFYTAMLNFEIQYVYPLFPVLVLVFWNWSIFFTIFSSESKLICSRLQASCIH